MLNERCAQILRQILYSQQPLKIDEIANSLGVSERTIRYDLDRIDEYLLENEFPVFIRKPNEGVSLDTAPEQLARLLCCVHDQGNYNYVLSQDERLVYLLYDLLEQDSYTTLQQLAEKMSVSKTTIQNDIKEIKERLGPQGMFIETAKGKGIKVIGDEAGLRKMASKSLFSHFDTLNLCNVNFIRLFKDIDMAAIEGFVREAERQLKYTFSDYAFNNLVIHLAIAIKRIQLGRDIFMNPDELKHLTHTAEFAVAAGIARRIEETFAVEIPQGEIGYITIHLLGSNFSLEQEQEKDHDIYLQMIISNLVEKMSQEYHCAFYKDEQLYENLRQHMCSAIYRFRHGININNPLLNDIKENYAELFSCVCRTVRFWSKDWQASLSDEECGYICIHFMTSHERLCRHKERRAKVLIVCATGVGTSKFVLTRLHALFDFEVAGMVAMHDAADFVTKTAVDLVVTTVPLKIEGVKTIAIQPFLNEKNISELSIFFSQYASGKPLSSENDKIPVIKEILQVVESCCKVEEPLKLELALQELLMVKKNIQPTLVQLIEPHRICRKKRAADWRDAVRMGGNLLLADGCITEQYIEAMIENIDNLGDYIILCPGVAMPHAKPGDGGLKTGFSLLLLEEALSFGKGTDKKVQVLITLAAADYTTHTNALKDLMRLLEQPDFVPGLLAAKEETKIMALFS